MSCGSESLNEAQALPTGLSRKSVELLEDTCHLAVVAPRSDWETVWMQMLWIHLCGSWKKYYKSTGQGPS